MKAKKLIALILAVVACLSLCACSGETEETAETTEPVVEEVPAQPQMLTEDQVETFVLGAFVDALFDLQGEGTYYFANIGNTRYSIGSIVYDASENYTGGYHHTVKGTFTLYDDYGDILKYGGEYISGKRFEITINNEGECYEYKIDGHSRTFYGNF